MTEEPVPIISGSREGDAIIVRCEACGKPIRDDGYLWIDNGLIREYDDAVREWEARIDAKNTDSRFRTINGADLFDHPEPVQWRAHHAACNPFPNANAYAIDAKNLATYRDLVRWTAHLMGKSWLESSDWDKVLRDAAAQ